MRILFYLKYIARQARDYRTFVGRLKQLDYLMKGRKVSQANITLSTMHGAKGLEFDTVFLIDLNKNIIPAMEASSIQTKEDQLNYEEERRLFYVGMTRARNSLSLVSTKKIIDEETEVSQFIKELIK